MSIRVKEDEPGAALGAGAGDGAEIEHAVWRRRRRDIRGGERRRGRVRECSTLLCFIYISDTLLHRGAGTCGATERERGCVCVSFNVGMNDS